MLRDVSRMSGLLWWTGWLWGSFEGGEGENVNERMVREDSEKLVNEHKRSITALVKDQYWPKSIFSSDIEQKRRQFAWSIRVYPSSSSSRTKKTNNKGFSER